MSKVAARFWNSKVHKQLDAKAKLKALGILTGDEVSMLDVTPPRGKVSPPYNLRKVQAGMTELEKQYWAATK